MALDEPPEDDSLCGKELSSKPGKYCDNDVTQDDGRCGFHSENTEHHGKGGRWKHGAYADPGVYFEKLSDDEQDEVTSIYRSFLEEAPFDEERKGKAKMLWDVAIELHKKKSINDYIANEGVYTEKFAGAGESGVFYEDEENPLHLTYDRLARSSLKTLKELGVINEDAESQKAEAQQSLVDILSANFED